MSLFSEKYFLLTFLFLAFQLLPAEAQRTILYQDEFIGEDGKGKVGTLPVDTTGVLWGIDVSGGAFGNNSFFSVGRLDSEVFEAKRVNGSVQWTSRIFNVTGQDNLEFSFDALADGTFDISDVFRVEIVIDGAAELLFEGTVSGGTMSFGGVNLTSSLQTFTSSIVDTGSQAYIQITCDVDNQNELLGFDNLEVTGVPTLPTVGWTNPLSSTTETNSSQTITIPVFLVNYENPVDVSVSVAGSSSAEPSDYVLNTTSLSFTQNDTLDVSLTINSDSGYDNELIDLKLTETTTTGIIITPFEHVHAIIDDENEPPPTAFINEVNYQEEGNDPNNFVEVAISTNYTSSLELLSLFLYDGGNNQGQVYDSQTLDLFTLGTTSGGFTFFTWYPVGGIDKGPDGMALVFDGTVIEFLSYEGTFTAIDGPAVGSTSVDIGVADDNSSGLSLQLTGSCTGSDCPDGLTWEGPIPWTPGEINGPDQLLPVEWLHFSVSLVDPKLGVLLSWAVSKEENHAYYEVQRSVEGVNWISLARIQNPIQTELTEEGWIERAYEYVDKNPAQGLNLYRIRQVDIDGDDDYSPIRQVIIRGNDPSFTAYPIPAGDRIYLDGLSPFGDAPVSIELVDMNGRSLQVHTGSIISPLDVQDIKPGIYQLLVRDASGRILRRQRVVIQ